MGPYQPRVSPIVQKINKTTYRVQGGGRKGERSSEFYLTYLCVSTPFPDSNKLSDKVRGSEAKTPTKEIIIFVFCFFFKKESEREYVSIQKWSYSLALFINLYKYYAVTISMCGNNRRA